MHDLFDVSWRIYPASLLIAAGALILLRGLRRERRWSELPARDATRPLRLVEALRLLLAGTALVALGAGWAWQIGWLAILALIFGAEEAFETTFLRYGLTSGAKIRLRP